MADLRIEFQHPRDRDLTTVYAVLRQGSKGVKLSNGALVTLTEASWDDFAIPLSDVSIPYLYVASPPAGTSIGDYELGIFESADVTDPIIRNIDDALVGSGTFVWRGAAGDTPPPETGGMADIRTEIKTSLGTNSIEVELTTSDLDKCIRDSLRVLNRERPPTAWGTLQSVSNGIRYTISHPGLYGILDVSWASATRCDPGCDPFYRDDPIAALGLGGIGYAGGGSMIGDRVQDLMYRSQVNDVTGRSPEWDQRWVRNQDNTRTLYLMLSDVAANAGVMYEYAWHLTADDDVSTGVAQIPVNDRDWVIRYALAKAKQILGRVLRKYNGGINMPDGGTETLDGDALASRGEQEQTDLEAEMRERRRPILPVVA